MVQTFYGQLKYIVELLLLPASEILGIPNQQQLLLACIEPCITQGKDVTLEVKMYTRMSTAIFIDIQAVGTVVGQIKRRNEWAIVDRNSELARTVFVDPVLDDNE